MTEKIADRIARLERSLKAARAAEKKRALELADRQKWLIGAVMQDRIARGLISADDLRGWMDADLTQPADRAVFDLPPLPAAPEQPPTDYQPTDYQPTDYQQEPQNHGY